MKLPAYTEEIHAKLTKLLNVIDPAFIANDDANEYYHIAGYALCNDDSLDLVSAINAAIAQSIDEKYILNKEESDIIIENF